ncbi:MAG TPA: mandelate racemase/muconate lactonizing enzyme family protein [Chloroflexota bacterium]|nr:mandelate racemase/muconate lactonizing enzyme family protein [Chloroflexota bacterium]
MKIADLEVRRYVDRGAGREIVVVTVLSDQGLSGLGFANAAVSRGVSTGPLLQALLEQQLKPLIVGEDPLLNEDLWQRLYGSVAARLGRRGMPMACLAAIDFALWDIKAKALGVPLSMLLGGRRERIATYVNAGHQLPPDQLAERAAAYVAAGHTAIKIRAGLSAVSLAEASRRVAAVREAIGPATRLMVDVNGTWDAETAIEMLKQWQRYDVYWLEEPVAPDNVAGYVRVRQRAGTTLIAGGEQHVGVGEFFGLLSAQAIDFAQPNAAATGGITDWLKIYHLATAFSIPVSPWNLQPIHIHLAAALPNVKWIEYFLPDNPLHDFQTRLWSGPHIEEVRDETGVYLRPPASPGIGLTLDETEAARTLVSS